MILALAISLLAATIAPALPAGQDAVQQADSLLQAFDEQKGSEASRTARKFFDLLDEEEFTDGEIVFPSGSRDEQDRLKALTWYWAGEWYFDRQDNARSMEYSLKALKLSKSTKDILLEADCSNILSILYFRKSDYPKALDYAKRTLEIGREQNDISRISYSLNTLAGICLASRQPAQGEQYILEAIRLCEQEKDSLKLAVRCGMAAEIYHGMGEDRKSLEYSRRAYSLDTLACRTDKAAIRLSQMAVAHFSLKETEQARKCLDKAMPVLKEAGNLQSWAISANIYGEILLESGDSVGAEQYFREALEIFSMRHDSYNESRSRLGLGKALLKSDPAESAIQMQIYGKLRDSLYDSQMNMGLNEMHARYQNDKLRSERDSYRRGIIAALLCSILLFLTLAYLVFIHRRRKALQTDGSSTSEKAGIGEIQESPELPENIADSEFMEKLKACIGQAMKSGKIDIEEIASQMCISRTHLNRKVKSITGGTTSDLVLSYRISEAKELLLNTGLPVCEVAEKCGIQDPTYFSTLFKKAVGKSPGQFRSDRG
ncbi:MAG: tetratricopeptide repeat protein [Candidatus Cryptobacteroides sp.]